MKPDGAASTSLRVGDELPAPGAIGSTRALSIRRIALALFAIVLAILPLATSVLTGIAQGLSGWFEGAALRVDLDRVPALVEDRERLWGMVSAATFLSDAEKRAMLDVKEGA